MPKRIGIGFTGTPFSVRQTVKYVQFAERTGFESAWFAEDYFLRDAITPLACYAYATKSIKVSTGVINPYTRNPVLIAETLATLDELSNGRAMLALGTGVSPLVEQMGITLEKPLAKIRETVHIIRSLLSGEELTFNGKTTTVRGVRLGYNPYFEPLGLFQPVRMKIPIYVAAVGPRMLRLAGEIGDGVLLTAGASPGYVRSAVKEIRTGAERSGRNLSQIDIANYIVLSVTKDGNPYTKGVRGFIAFELAFADQRTLELAGIPASKVVGVRDLFNRKGAAYAADLVTEEMVDAFSATGSPRKCLDRIGDYTEAGVTLPIILPLGGDVRLAIETVGSAIK